MFKLDVDSFVKKLENKKKQLQAGFDQAKIDVQPLLIERMTINIQREVYDVYTPKKYERTYDLLNSVTTIIKGDNVYVFTDTAKMTGDWSRTVGGKMTEHNNLPYAYRVQGGDGKYQYEFRNDGAYQNPRDWVQVTYNDLADAAKTGNSELLMVVVAAVKKHFK